MKDLSHLNQYRIKNGPLASSPSMGNYGAFWIPLAPSTWAVVLAADSEVVKWEHVSVHIRYETSRRERRMRTPTWDEMCKIKDLFWDPEEAVMQLHVPASQHINNHPHVLHLWRPEDGRIPMPPPETLGIRELAS